MEFGGRGYSIPAENIDITSYIHKALPKLDIASSIIKVLAPERTFWEKILILQKLAHLDPQKGFPGRHSRHYYDINMLSLTHIVDKALQNDSLLDKARLHNMAYFRSAQASYGTAKRDTIKLLPKKLHMEMLENDYIAMNDMFISAPPAFEKLMESILQVEEKINS